MRTVDAAGRTVVVMGVSAVGKSSVSAGLAVSLDIPFVDADDLHPAANIAKMSAGEPLSDSDRWPWLDSVGEVLARGASESGVVVACSALRRTYRDRLRMLAPTTTFVHLTAKPAVLAARVAARSGHFMPPALLSSQLEALEPLDADERGFSIDVGASLKDVVATAVRGILAGRSS